MIKTKTITLLALVLSSCSMKLSTIESPDVYATRKYGFSQAVVFDHVIYGSGQVGWDKDFKLPQPPDFNNQLEQTLKNIENLLHSQKCSWQDVLNLRFYVVDLNPAKRERIGAFLQQTFQSGYAPATTMLGISALARENLLIEIEFTARAKHEVKQSD